MHAREAGGDAIGLRKIEQPGVVHALEQAHRDHPGKPQQHPDHKQMHGPLLAARQAPADHQDQHQPPGKTLADPQRVEVAEIVAEGIGIKRRQRPQADHQGDRRGRHKQAGKQQQAPPEQGLRLGVHTLQHCRGQGGQQKQVTLIKKEATAPRGQIQQGQSRRQHQQPGLRLTQQQHEIARQGRRKQCLEARKIPPQPDHAQQQQAGEKPLQGLRPKLRWNLQRHQAITQRPRIPVSLARPRNAVDHRHRRLHR